MEINWTEVIIAFVAGGSIQAVVTYIQSSRASSKTDFESIVHTLQDDNNRLRAENKELHNEIDVLRSRLRDLETIVDEIKRNQNNK